MAKSAYAWAVTGALGVGACVLGVATLLDHGPSDAIPRPAVTVGPSASTTGVPESSTPSPSARPSASPTPTDEPSPTKSASPTRKPTKQVTTSASTAPSAVSAVSPASPVSAD